MLETNWGTDLVLKHHHRHVSHTHRLVSHSHTTQVSILRNILVNMVQTSIYEYVLSIYWYVPVQQHVLIFIWGSRHYFHAWVPPCTCPTYPVSLPTVQQQTNVRETSMSVHIASGNLKLCTYQYVPVMYKYLLTLITLTLHFQSGTITIATLTSLLQTLVQRLAGSILSL
jgi:hypothetical protein